MKKTTHSTLSTIPKPKRGYWLKHPEETEIFLGETKHLAGRAFNRLPEKVGHSPAYVMFSYGPDIAGGNAWAPFEIEAADLE